MEECILDPDYDDYSYRLQQKTVTARKEHVCGECGHTISTGNVYEIYKGVQDGSIFTCKTCLDCVSIRDSFFKDGIAQFGSVLDDVRENIIYELAGVVDSKCILPLTEKAKDRVFGWIEEAWEE